MTATIFITNWLNEITQKFNWVKFKYEFVNGTHHLAVFPQAIIEFDEDYCREENLFYDNFIAKYPNDDLYIGIEENFFICSENALIFESNQKSYFEISVSNDHETVDIPICSNFNCNSMYPNGYDFLLAA